MFELMLNIPDLNIIGAELERAGYYKAMQSILKTQQIMSKMFMQSIMGSGAELNKQMIDQRLNK